MRANILGEDGDDVVVQVFDNDDAEHAIVVELDGSIQNHGQEAYATDPSERTDEEDQHVARARRFARYHVYREKGYDTLPAGENPDRIAAVLLAILDLSDEEFEAHFGRLHSQARGHERAPTDAPLDLPADLYERDSILYKQNIYLEEELDAMQSAVSEQPAEAITEEMIAELVQTDDFVSTAASLFSPDNTDYGNLTIEGTSGIDVMYTEHGERKTIAEDDPFDREPDARLEVYPTDFDLQAFRFYVGHNLVCQIRDCFVSMGVEPPAQYRVLGQGKYKYTRKYDAFDFYPDYWDYDANVPGYIRPVPM